MIMLGISNRDIAVNLGVNESTFYKWMKDVPEFSKAVVKAREMPARVANSLRKRAEGFTKETEKLFHFQGHVVRVKTKTYFPPDTGAAIHILEKKHPELWGKQIGSATANNNGSGSAAIYVDPDTMALAGAEQDADATDDDGLEAGEV